MSEVERLQQQIVERYLAANSRITGLTDGALEGKFRASCQADMQAAYVVLQSIVGSCTALKLVEEALKKEDLYDK